MVAKAELHPGGALYSMLRFIFQTYSLTNEDFILNPDFAFKMSKNLIR
jgi:hypothetical protein